MYNNDFKKILEEEPIIVSENDCYLAISKVGYKASVSLEGKEEILVGCLVNLMKKYADLREVILEAADVYDEE